MEANPGTTIVQCVRETLGIVSFSKKARRGALSASYCPKRLLMCERDVRDCVIEQESTTWCMDCFILSEEAFNV